MSGQGERWKIAEDRSFMPSYWMVTDGLKDIAQCDTRELAEQIVSDHNARLAATDAGAAGDAVALQTLGELKAEMLDALEELPRASYGDNETNIERWIDYINDTLREAALATAEGATEVDGG